MSEVIKRINELAKKKREGALTEEDLEEKKKLYEVYLSFIRGQVTQTLEQIKFVDPPLEEAPKKKTGQPH